MLVYLNLSLYVLFLFIDGSEFPICILVCEISIFFYRAPFKVLKRLPTIGVRYLLLLISYYTVYNFYSHSYYKSLISVDCSLTNFSTNIKNFLVTVSRSSTLDSSNVPTIFHSFSLDTIRTRHPIFH